MKQQHWRWLKKRNRYKNPELSAAERAVGQQEEGKNRKILEKTLRALDKVPGAFYYITLNIEGKGQKKRC